jgi:hypothetical protein
MPLFETGWRGCQILLTSSLSWVGWLLRVAPSFSAIEEGKPSRWSGGQARCPAKGDHRMPPHPGDKGNAIRFVLLLLRRALKRIATGNERRPDARIRSGVRGTFRQSHLVQNDPLAAGRCWKVVDGNLHCQSGAGRISPPINMTPHRRRGNFGAKGDFQAMAVPTGTGCRVGSA